MSQDAAGSSNGFAVPSANAPWQDPAAQQLPQPVRAPGKKRPAPELEWDWPKLLAEDSKVRNGAWSDFMASLRFAAEVPMESCNAVLDCGYIYWV